MSRVDGYASQSTTVTQLTSRSDSGHGAEQMPAKLRPITTTCAAFVCRVSASSLLLPGQGQKRHFRGEGVWLEIHHLLHTRSAQARLPRQGAGDQLTAGQVADLVRDPAGHRAEGVVSRRKCELFRGHVRILCRGSAEVLSVTRYFGTG